LEVGVPGELGVDGVEGAEVEEPPPQAVRAAHKNVKMMIPNSIGRMLFRGGGRNRPGDTNSIESSNGIKVERRGQNFL
jgi:hypothetical protein